MVFGLRFGGIGSVLGRLSVTMLVWSKVGAQFGVSLSWMSLFVDGSRMIDWRTVHAWDGTD